MISKQIEDELDRREYDRCEENWRSKDDRKKANIIEIPEHNEV